MNTPLGRSRLPFLLMLLVLPPWMGASESSLALPVESWAERVYSGSLDAPGIVAGLSKVQAELSGLTGNTRNVALIQVRLSAFQGLIDLERKDLAERVLKEAEALLPGLQNRDSADLRALAVEVRSKMLGIKDVGFIISNAGAIQEEAENILKLSPGNLRARFVTAYGRIYAPALFGGNPDRSRQLFQSILAENPPEKSVRFLAWVGLSEAWRKLGNKTERMASLRQAESLFPGNPGLRKLKALE